MKIPVFTAAAVTGLVTLTNPGGASAAVRAPNGTITVKTFAAAPGFSQPGGTKRTGTLNAGENYVYCRQKGPRVTLPEGTNDWWLKTDLDSGDPTKDQWVSAYYLAGQGNDEANDLNGQPVPECHTDDMKPVTPPSDDKRVKVTWFYKQSKCEEAGRRGEQGGKWRNWKCFDHWNQSNLYVTPTLGANDNKVLITQFWTYFYSQMCQETKAEGIKNRIWKDAECIVTGTDTEQLFVK